MSYGQKETTQNQTTQTNPWAPAIPFLTDLLHTGAGEIPHVTGAQTNAFGQLEGNAAGGNPFAGDINKLAGDTFNAGSNSGQVQQYLDQLQGNLGRYASGQNLDFSKNPEVQNLLSTIQSDVSNRVNRQFAGAGRDLSGMNTQTLARGISQGEAQPLLDLFQGEEGRQIGAAQALANAGMGGAQLKQALDTGALTTRAGGIPLAEAALQAKNYGPNAILNLEQQRQSLPMSDLAQWAQLLLPVAGLGGQSTSRGNSNTSGWGVGLGGDPMSTLGKAWNMGAAGASALGDALAAGGDALGSAGAGVLGLFL